MADVAEFRFLPWTRRGLSTRLAHAPAMPARADISVGVTVTGATADPVALTLYGPGDVLGLDTRLIVRTDPVANATDVEPNYVAAVDFELPDLPWMFTPTGPTAEQHLPPWLVLICVDASKVDPPRVQPGTPLPRITIPGDVAGDELPDLADSYAWAHTQVLRSQDDGPVTGADLAAEPALDVSRIVCPRHLEPNRAYHACLVPAFDVGVERGLTGQMPTAATAGPAWGADPGETTLPVYFHWTFATGPAGDFETLARRLRPFECPPEVGAAPMYVGAAGPGLPQRPADEAGGVLEMDGALRSVNRDNGTLADVPDDLEAGLRRAVNAPAEHAAGTAGDTDPIGPPVYAGLHLDEQRVADSGAGFLRELNVDPRRRAAGGIGAALVRHEQEDMVHQAWQQVGDVLKANQLLGLARLMEDVLDRLHERHIRTLPPDRLLQVAGPSLHRMLVDDVTLPHALARTSLPQRAFDGALRRQLAPTGRIQRVARDFAGVEQAAPGVQSPVVQGLADGEVTIDPNHGYTPDGIGGVAGADRLPEPDADGLVDLGPLGFDTRVPGGLVRGAAATEPRRDRPGLRRDLGTTGIVTDAHLAELHRTPAGAVTRGGIGAAVEALRTATAQHPSAIAFVADAELGEGLTALEIEDGALVRRDPDGQRTVVARMSERLTVRADAPMLEAIVGSLEPGTLRAGPGEDPVLTLDLDGVDIVRLPEPGTGGGGRVVGRLGRHGTLGGGVLGGGRLPGGGVAGGRVPGRGGVPGGGRLPGEGTGPLGRGGRTGPGDGEPSTPPPATAGEANTVPAPLRAAEVVQRFTTAFEAVQATLAATGSATPAADVQLVPFDLAAARSTVLERSAPRSIVPRRVRSRLSVGGVSLLDVVDGRFLVPHTHDRIWVAPTLPTPLYELLARYDSDRFLPGVEVIPPNAVTLVETNPHFIESFLVGVNHEFNGELLWRGFPTDRRGTSMRWFWDWFDGGPDIDEIHTWHPGSRLGTHARGAGSGNIVLLVRGDLLRRYPDASVYAWRADGEDLMVDPGDDDIAMPVFAGRFDPDFTFAGFPLTQDDLDDGDGWFFVIAEQPTEPRFGMDTGSAVPTDDWADLSWGGAGVAPGGHLRLGTTALTATIDGLRLAGDAAQFAAITLQRPFRVAIHARHMVEGL